LIKSFIRVLTRKRASTRRVNRKIADSTRNQRVFFSRYHAANYGVGEGSDLDKGKGSAKPTHTGVGEGRGPDEGTGEGIREGIA